jgi:hypothetical protein
MNPPGLSLLTFNIGNPSPGRAQRQLAWLASRDEHVLVLTETKASAGCQLLAGAFTAAGRLRAGNNRERWPLQTAPQGPTSPRRLPASLHALP